MSIDTLANVKARLGITTSADDALLDLLRASADLWVVNRCGRDFGGGTYTEYHPGGSEFVHLRNFPVQSITSVKVDPSYGFGASTLIDPSAYTVHLDRGVVQSLVGPFPAGGRRGLLDQDVRPWSAGPRVVQVVYVVATAAAPDDVLQAYSGLVGHWYRQVKTRVAAGQQNVIQQKYGDTWASFAADRDGVPPEVERLLEPYRVPNL